MLTGDDICASHHREQFWIELLFDRKLPIR